MAFASFKRDSGLPPPEYRTPSPPIHDGEILATRTTRFEGSFKQPAHDGGIGTRNEDGTTKSVASGSDKFGGKRRSVMEDFASIALATEFPQRRHTHGGSSSYHQIITSIYQGERTHKRARSDNHPIPEICSTYPRPSTSYSQPPNPPQFEDAELLLNFSREASFAVPKIPASRSKLAMSLSTISSDESNTFQPRALLQSLAAAVRGERAKEVAPEPNWDTSHENTFENGQLDSDGTRLMPIANDHTSEILTQIRSTGLPEKYPAFMNGWQIDWDLVGKSSSCPRDGQGKRLNTHLDAAPSDTLDSLDQDASGLSISRDNEAAAKMKTSFNDHPPNSVFGPATKMTPTTRFPGKGKQPVEPSICASCHCSRNALPLVAEKDATLWISCDGCKSWFHFACAGFKNEREVRAVDKYRCRSCKAIHGSTTYVRKSSRAHSAIDYAGLNEGVLKTSDENPEHHYIKPIKDGILKFQSECFARMRPELVTADYFLRGDGMREPIVIPAAFNPRPPPIPNEDEQEQKSEADVANDLHDHSLLSSWLSDEFEYEIVPDEGQDALGMVMPRDLTVRKVSELYGPHEKIDVIDVKSQNGEDKKWDMKRWVDYYESPGSKRVRNVISLEFSHSKLARLIRRPQVVRDLDLQNAVWPADLRAKGEYPKVQFYCLMSVADCFTDFHIDFGGSSVFYHILKGKKTFFFIPPHEKHLKKYEEWCKSPAQNNTFLGDQTKECYRVDLSAGDTMLIPAGWIHAVWTPEDSLVIGGNFLTAMHYPIQIRIAQMEKATGVARRFRYPHFQKLLWFAALKYLQMDPIPDSLVESLLSGQAYHREIPLHLEYEAHGAFSEPGLENYNARYYSKHELDGLPELGRYLQRTALIAKGNITDGVSVETRNAVKRSIPKGYGDPLHLVKRFALWYTWKQGNKPLPHWAYPDYVYQVSGPKMTEKKLSAAALRRLERESALQAWRMAPHRQSTRRKSQSQALPVEPANGDASGNGDSSAILDGSTDLPGNSEVKKSVMRNTDDLLNPTAKSAPSPHKKQKRVPSAASAVTRKSACDSCRKRRRACKHKDESISNWGPSNGLNSRQSEGSNGIKLKQVEVPEPRQVTSEHLSYPMEYGMRNDLQELHFSTPKGKGTTPLSESKSPSASDGSQSKLSSRSKACSECRKSKRRCVHDEGGNQDPVKVAEAVIPRPIIKKRKLSSEASYGLVRKIRNAGSLGPVSFESESSVIVEMIAVPVENPPRRDEKMDIPAVEAQIQSELQPYFSALSDASKEARADITTNISKPDILAATDFNLIDTSPLLPLKIEAAFASPLLPSQLFAERPTSLASPPDSTNAADTDLSPSAPAPLNGITPPITNISSRHSSHPAQHTKQSVQRCTPESGRRASSGSTTMISVEVTHNGPPGSGMTDRRKSRGASEVAADEESMRLIRALQAQDMGLRRRARA